MCYNNLQLSKVTSPVRDFFLAKIMTAERSKPTLTREEFDQEVDRILFDPDFQVKRENIANDRFGGLKWQRGFVRSVISFSDDPPENSSLD